MKEIENAEFGIGKWRGEKYNFGQKEAKNFDMKKNKDRRRKIFV
jgi:hypothetical protein